MALPSKTTKPLTRKRQMCLLINNKEGLPIPLAILEKAAKSNSHGYGRLDLTTGKVKKTLNMEKAVRMASKPGPAIHHFRYATVGEKTAQNAHPFHVAKDWYIFQNGTVNGFADTGKVDTDSMAHVLRLVHPDNWEKALSYFSSRYIVANSRTKEIIQTGKGWVERDGVWYSNDLSFPYEPSYRSNVPSYRSNTVYSRSYSRDHEVSEVPTLIAVYGTLKMGQALEHYMEDSRLVGWGFTAEAHRLCLNNVPTLIKGGDKSKGAIPVEVEVYEVDDETLAKLDKVEGHPHLYKREMVRIQLWKEEAVWAWVYFASEKFDNGEYYFCYGESWTTYREEEAAVHGMKGGIAIEGDQQEEDEQPEVFSCPRCHSRNISADGGFIGCDECGHFTREEEEDEWTEPVAKRKRKDDDDPHINMGFGLGYN